MTYEIYAYDWNEEKAVWSDHAKTKRELSAKLRTIIDNCQFDHIDILKVKP